MIVNYFAWLNILSLAIKLLNSPSVDDGILIKVFSENSKEINLSAQQSEVFHIDLYSKVSGVKLKGYILIPRQDIFAAEESERYLFPFVPNAVFLTVNEFAVIFEETIQNTNLPKSKTHLPYINNIQRILGIDQNQKLLEKRDAYTTSDGVHVIQMQEYPQFVELQVAKNGSSGVDYSIIKKLFPHKMIFLSLIPDTGKVFQIWLKGGDVDFPKHFFEVQDEVTKRLSAFLSEKESVSFAEIKNLKQDIKKLIPKNQVFDQVLYDYFDDFVNRILQWEVPKTFSGYHPKQTPDRVLDFMPQISDDINDLPIAEPENLQKLTALFKKYQKIAKKNKGKWIEGNPILGAKPKEYKPTAEELILGEIGSRIVTVLKKIDKNQWHNLWKQQKLKHKKLVFTDFSFIHYDVMGSGRFFYVKKMKKITIKWNKKVFEIVELPDEKF